MVGRTGAAGAQEEEASGRPGRQAARALTFQQGRFPGTAGIRRPLGDLGMRPGFSGLVEVFKGLLRSRRSLDKQAFLFLFSFF